MLQLVPSQAAPIPLVPVPLCFEDGEQHPLHSPQDCPHVCRCAGGSCFEAGFPLGKRLVNLGYKVPS